MGRSGLRGGAAIAAVFVVALLALAGAALLVATPESGPPTELREFSERPGQTDAVVALAGEEDRLEVAREIADLVGSELVLSWVPGSESDRDERCRQDEVGPRARPQAVCFVPDPVTTAGEARSIGDLAVAHDWENVVVVTSRYHVRRAETLIGQCLDDARFEVVPATERLPAQNVVYESVGLLVGLTLQRAC